MTNPKKLNVVGPQVRMLRKWRRWTQSDLSTKLCSLGWKVSRGSVAQIEITQKRITDCDLIYLAKALNVTIADFFPSSFSPQNVRSKIKSRRLMRRQITSSSRSHPIRVTKTRFDFKEAWQRRY
jgi:transcriptional regulator with XRE-family HTH domain